MPGPKLVTRNICALGLGLVLLLVAAVASAPAQLIPESSYGALHWRLLGPFRAGWATAVAGIPGNSTTFYFGGADGGVWRTTDAGITWQSLFDRQGSASIGALAVAPSNTAVIWAGTGQVHQRWDIVSGDGVYRSTDGGEHWTHAGLDETRHIGNIWVDPRNADVALVAALGHVFGPNDMRGIFRTEDGGRSWKKVLFRDADTGAVDIAADAAFPDVIYASLWQVRRHPWLDYFQPTVGPGSGIYKSTDGGRNWSPVGRQGLPTIPVGRIELAVVPGTRARGVWALIQSGEQGGLYRSEDGGATWTRINPDTGLASDYYSGLVPDPADAGILWAMGRSLRRSQDGGKTFSFVKGSPGGDDYHCLWIDPRDPHRMITGADQGAVITLNGGLTWSSWYNQPTGQFYRLAADSGFPYRIYSGQQDSGTVSMASRSDYGQVTFRDWHPVGGDERDGDVPDPLNPDIVYGAGLGGRLSKWDARTGQVQNVSPWPITSYGERPTSVRYRYSWITPLAISRRPGNPIYMGAQVLFRSMDGGRAWDIVSPDLTGADPAARVCAGDVPVDRATACGYGVIFAIAPSPRADGQVWFGTDNGRIQVTRNDGASWTDVTPPDMGDWTKVNIIDASANDPATAYIAADRHRLDDRRPLAWRTHDFGRNWQQIGDGLPQEGWVGVVREDPAQPGLLYAGTNRGVYVSFDDGDHWQSLQLNLPRTGINDLLVHEDDVIIATQGRGLWVLDDIGPLRQLSETAPAGVPLLLPPATAYRLRANENKDTPLPPEEPRAPNPPAGAVLDYMLPKAPGTPVVIEISGPDGAPVRRFASNDKPARPRAEVYFADSWLAPLPVPTAQAGHNRFVWDLRYPAPQALESEYSIAAVPGGAFAEPAGPFVLPGMYEVRLTVDGQTIRQPLTVVMDPRVNTSEAELAALLAFQREVAAELARSARLAEARKSKPPAPAAAAGGSTEDPAEINAILTALARDLETADAAPTAPQKEVLQFCRQALDRAEKR